MKKNFLLATIISTSILLISFANASNSPAPSMNTADVAVDNDSMMVDAETNNASFASALYNNLALESKGLSEEVVLYAVNGYRKLEAQGKVNTPLLTIIDMEQSSRKKRMYIIDMEKEELVWNTFVSHGKNSGIDKATRFSNKVNSNQSSLGFYVTANTYFGKHGLSLRLRGQENGFNHNAEARAIVVHGADYVNASRVNSAYMGRSLGCPALPSNESSKVINMIKDGSVMFIYHPTNSYVSASKMIRA